MTNITGTITSKNISGSITTANVTGEVLSPLASNIVDGGIATSRASPLDGGSA